MKSVVHRLARVEEAQKQRTSFFCNTMTRAEMVQQQRREGVLLHSAELDVFLSHHKVQWWPHGGSRKFPKLGDQESNVCQRFVTTMLSKLAKKTVTVQENVGNQTIAKQVEIRSLPELQAFRKKAISLRSLDAVFYDGETRGEAAVTMLGEVKGRGSGDFPDDEVGQLIRGITRLLHCQMFRATSIGFLTDGSRFMFARGVRQRGGYLTFDTSRIFNGADGWQVRVYRSICPSNADDTVAVPSSETVWTHGG